MGDVLSFEEIGDEFQQRVEEIVWCTVSTVDRAGRPRSRILHPIWEETTGWIATGRHSHKEKHLAANPHVSLSYWSPKHDLMYVDCTATWEDSLDERRRIWELFKGTPPPLGYDPGTIWPAPEHESFGLLRLAPWRIQVHSLADQMARRPARVWRPAP